MSRKQSDAVVARIKEVPQLANAVFKTVAPHGQVKPYVIVHPASGLDTQERFTGPKSTMHPRFTLHVVGSTPDEVESVTDRVKAKFIVQGFGVPMVVAGESCRGLWWEAPTPIQVQTDPQPTVIYQVVELGWDADPI